jgi:hypothetical protein
MQSHPATTASTAVDTAMGQVDRLTEDLTRVREQISTIGRPQPDPNPLLPRGRDHHSECCLAIAFGAIFGFYRHVRET